MCLSLLSVQCPGGAVVCQELSNCFRPVEPRNAFLPGHQSQVLKENPLGGLHAPARCQGTRQCGVGRLTPWLWEGHSAVQAWGVATGTRKEQGEPKIGSLQHLGPWRES